MRNIQISKTELMYFNWYYLQNKKYVNFYMTVNKN